MALPPSIRLALLQIVTAVVAVLIGAPQEKKAGCLGRP
jgi:hypothetical protein